MKGLLYEPRAFWSIGRIDTADDSGRPPFTVQLPPEHFLNGEKYPVTVTRVCVAPINYQFDRYTNADPASSLNVRNDGVSAIERTRVVIGAPQRQYYLRRPANVQTFTPRPTSTPNPPGLNFGTVDGVSSLWGLTRWRFDKPMIIPRLGDLDFELSSYAVFPTANEPTQPVFTQPRGYVAFEEVGAGMFGGNARMGGFFLRRSDGSNPPFQPDAWGAPTGAGQGTAALWDARMKFSARDFAAQNPTSDGSIPITAFSVMIDQQSLDEEVLTDIPNGQGTVVSPLALRVAARARMRNGGTGTWWWRDGAPLALVCPTITPAQVYDLPEPITLGPGERLSVEVSGPGPLTIDEQQIDSIYQIGVSLCGYASIEA